MTQPAPLTDQQLDDEAEIAKLRGLLAKENARANAAIDREETAEQAALEAQAALAKEQRLHGDTIDDRDRAQDMADKLAYAVAPETVIGEHTADNSPWANALDLITSAAEVDKLRAEQQQPNDAEAHRCALSEALHLGNGAPWDAIIDRAGELSRRDVEARKPEIPPVEDTLPAWLYSRFNESLDAPVWELLTDADRTYWEHQAAAVRRAVARGGFKNPASAAAAGSAGDGDQR